MPFMLLDDDRPDSPVGRRFRVIVIVPAFVKRLIERVRRWLGGA